MIMNHDQYENYLAGDYIRGLPTKSPPQVLNRLNLGFGTQVCIWEQWRWSLQRTWPFASSWVYVMDVLFSQDPEAGCLPRTKNPQRQAPKLATHTCSILPSQEPFQFDKQRDCSKQLHVQCTYQVARMISKLSFSNWWSGPPRRHTTCTILNTLQQCNIPYNMWHSYAFVKYHHRRSQLRHNPSSQVALSHENYTVFNN